MPSWTLSLAIGAVAPWATTALLVAPNSPCAQQCGNVLTNDTGSDMTCSEEAYSTTTAGQVFENCINCQLNSRFAEQGQSDLQWMLYNIRFAASWCLWGFPGNKVPDTPCITSYACGPLEASVEWDNLTTAGGALDYCDNWDSASLQKCEFCLRPAGEGNFLANFFVILDAACQQRPTAGSLLSLQGSTPFTTVPITITSPTPSAPVIPTTDYGPVSLGARVGIAFGGLAFFLALTGFCIVLNGKRRRRRFLQDLKRRHVVEGGGWPRPNNDGGRGGGGGGGGGGQGQDIFETPVSLKPLCGWNDSPRSAHTEGNDHLLPGHFSSYSNISPTSATKGGPHTMIWPSTHHQHNHPRPFPNVPPPPMTQQEMVVGLALGGGDASLPCKPSDMSLGGPQQNQQRRLYHSAVDERSKGKEREEAYELVESTWNGQDGKRTMAAVHGDLASRCQD